MAARTLSFQACGSPGDSRGECVTGRLALFPLGERVTGGLPVMHYAVLGLAAAGGVRADFADRGEA
jgi:hypothetical protein